MNRFVKAMQSKNTVTWNGAVSHSTSGVSCLDYFAKCGSYRGRTEAEVSADMAALFGEDPSTALKIIFYNRMITRKITGFDKTETVQRGQGAKDEFIKSIAWLENNHPDLLYDNLWLIPSVGCWKDLWYDSAATGFYYYVDPKRVYSLVKKGLRNEYHRGLLAKFLPKIRSAKSATQPRHKRLNAWARGLCAYLGWTERDYRKFKSGPEHTAHLWQRQACAGDWDEIDFNMISGKALLKFVGSGILAKHGLEKRYLEWIKKQPVAKFNGYPYELYKKAKTAGRKVVERMTYDAQFEKLLETARRDVNPTLLEKGVLCALDTSGSMGGGYWGQGSPDVAPIDVCVGLGIYFSSLLEGHFKDHVIMFDNQSRFLKLNGSFCDKVDQVPQNAMGGTNFQSVIDEIVRVRKANPSIPVEEYPQVLLVVSDMQFNPTNSTYGYYSRCESYGSEATNYEAAMRKLQAVGLPKMTIIWWQVNGRFTGDVPVKWDDEGTILISGFDGAIVTSLLAGMEEVVDETTGEKRQITPLEAMNKSLNQEILNRVKV